MKRHAAGSDKPCALFLAPEAPFPVAGGGPLRSASVLHYLASRYTVDAIMFREPGAADPARLIPRGLVREIRVLDLPPHSRSVPRRALRNAGRLLRRVPPLIDRFAGFSPQVAGIVAGRHYAVSVVEHFWCAPYWEQLAPVSAVTVLDLHNIESVLHERCGRTEKWPSSLVHRCFRPACARLESEWLPRYSRLLVASEQDAAAVRRICPGAHALVYPNAIPMAPLPATAVKDAIVFSGNMAYHPNISAVRFFRQKIWPGLRERFPSLVWRLIGKNPQNVRKLISGDDRIILTGPVEDAIPELAAARVAVVPVIAASGTRLKIVEAWAAGTPVVSSTIGAEGLPARHGQNILLADDPVSFQRAVAALLESPALARRIAGAGRAVFEKEFTWEAAWAGLIL